MYQHGGLTVEGIQLVVRHALKGFQRRHARVRSIEFDVTDPLENKHSRR